MRKGQKATDETRRRMSEARRGKGCGKKWSPEQRAKFMETMAQPEMRERLSAAIRVGQMRPEVRQRMSETHKGRNLTPEHIAAIKAGWNRPGVREHASEVFKGRKLPPEHCAAIKAGQATSEAQRKMSEAHKGRQPSLEHRAAQKAGLARPEVRARISAGVRRAQATEEYKAHRKAGLTPAVRARMSEAARARPDHMARIRRLAFLKRTTRLESAVMAWLDDHNIIYEQQYQIGWYHVDFYVASLNLVIEANGCWWHACAQCGFSNPKKVAFDQRRSAYLEKHGYALAIAWEHEVKCGDFATLEVALGLEPQAS